ncbi:MAG: hypothetical protein HRT89_21700 [Lentisphaeria bacterium]|nr:hypothetical protein [Lentisphaeria bacterium]NQZ70677.1 hypothetical protein [Lentisphaeria bacterium]
MKTGLCSITFRDLSVNEIIKLVADAQLDVIEWGGDIHVPQGNIKLAEETARLTREAGLTVSSYGSYERLTDDEFSPDQLLDTVDALDCKQLRIWGGRQGSATINSDDYNLLVDLCQVLTRAAQERGIEVSLEFHGNTVADTAKSCLDFIADVGQENLKCYYQQTINEMDALNLGILQSMKAHVSNFHCFYYENDIQVELIHGMEFWQKALEIYQPETILIEFVKDGEPQQFLDDATSLLKIINSVSG